MLSLEPPASSIPTRTLNPKVIGRVCNQRHRRLAEFVGWIGWGRGLGFLLFEFWAGLCLVFRGNYCRLRIVGHLVRWRPCEWLRRISRGLLGSTHIFSVSWWNSFRYSPPINPHYHHPIHTWPNWPQSTYSCSPPYCCNVIPSFHSHQGRSVNYAQSSPTPSK